MIVEVSQLPNEMTEEEPFSSQVVGLYTFEASAAEELPFKKNELLDIIDHPEHDPDWWMARNAHGQTGLVPKNYIEVLKKGEFKHEPWYYGRITRDEAEHILSQCFEGEYLVRESESQPGDYSVSMRGVDKSKQCKHFKVQTVDGQLRIGSRTFPDMNSLLKHYTENPIFSQGNEKLFLKRPVNRR